MTKLQKQRLVVTRGQQSGEKDVAVIKNGITKNYCDRTVPCLKHAGNHFNLLTLIDNLLKLIKTNKTHFKLKNIYTYIYIYTYF